MPRCASCTRRLTRRLSISPLKGGAVLFPNVAFKGYLEGAVLAGTYELEARLAGTTTVALALPPLTLEAGKIYDVFAVGKVAGEDDQALTTVVFTDDPSAPPAGKARVRVMHAVPDAPAMSIFVNDALAFFGISYKERSAVCDAGSRHLQRQGQTCVGRRPDH